ncbi:hypothetical protein M406DRAFT_321792 [Cryphonectria parasitica EP155]|uniref:Uncharacterized protein n=1 Tax=Cryphonectria parasitica (strain ATCC 38755 / EP155) TaxID=660469 RepID=A0A9P5CSA8_CRYP1|nr:uncharacterized protein M406DRAFT_321792 [Cryphonectria parasitica EP155]KAF3767960.1 hypothetical protein M406DRAFT_321792 [Cryphonectria parasitica EP155]
MANTVYTALPQHEANEEKENPIWPSTRRPLSQRWSRTTALLSALLLSSLIANFVLLYRQFVTPWDLINELPTRYAGLVRNVPTKITHHIAFDSTNRTEQDAAWDDKDLEPWTHFVALDEDYTIDLDLPHAQRWPWDLNKGVYILTAAHELHCVRVLRVAVNENHDGVPEEEQTWAYAHLIHCLNVLRDTVMCNADDTPLYVGRLHENTHSSDPRAGIGTTKMCRNWNTLLEWSRARSACYYPEDFFNQSYPEVERYKYCPDGSRPWETIEAPQAP